MKFIRNIIEILRKLNENNRNLKFYENNFGGKNCCF